jgi:hypothetical protein
MIIFAGRLALVGAFRLVNTIRIAFFALVAVETGFFFGAFLASLFADSKSPTNCF